MCGVVVLASLNEPLTDIRLLERMRDQLAHRGPDDRTCEVVDRWVGLGHRRLSIIDVEGARQPLRSEDGRVVCIFNGEIYNFGDLRNRLVALGHTFATAGDGEVIVHGYEQWGDAVFSKLEGMFTIALVDRNRRRLLLVRDRFGIKPMFYSWNTERLIAASELKALLVDPSCPRTASRDALELGAIRMHVPWPYTAFDGVYRLPPGAILDVTSGNKPLLTRFASMVTPVSSDHSSGSPEFALETLRAAVARQMVADVPVGAFLSGGIDSTLIVALMREVSRSELHTFSIRTAQHDESDVARETAGELGTTHHTIDLEDIKFEDLIELPRLFDEPFAETSALGIRALSNFARKHVKVALSGDGGDEVFGGYGSYRWIRAARTARVPGRGLIRRIAHPLLQQRPWSSIGRRALRAALLVGESPSTAQRDVSTLLWAASTKARTASELLSSRIRAACSSELEDVEPMREAMLADRFERLPNAMLSKVDTASMSASLEVRVPMLDDALVRYADGLPIDQLASLRWGKILLRRVLGKLPGGRVAWAKKRGFSLPLDRWMASAAIRPRLSELFNDHGEGLRDLTGEDVVALWNTFQNGGSRFSQGTGAMQLLWFANVALWADRFGVRSTSARAVAPPLV